MNKYLKFLYIILLAFLSWTALMVGAFFSIEVVKWFMISFIW